MTPVICTHAAGEHVGTHVFYPVYPADRIFGSFPHAFVTSGRGRASGRRLAARLHSLIARIVS